MKHGWVWEWAELLLRGMLCGLVYPIFMKYGALAGVAYTGILFWQMILMSGRGRGK